MRISFLTQGSLVWGSVRIRAANLTRTLRELGHLVYVGQDAQPGGVAIIGKSLDGTELVTSARKAGAKIIMDFCDSHFHHEKLAEKLDAVAGAAHRLTASCVPLAHLVSERYGREVTVIDETYEGPELPPKFAPREPLRIAWFGHKSNLHGLLDILPEVQKRGEVRVVSNQGPDIPGVVHVPWSQLAEATLLDWCDIVLIPVSKITPGRADPATKSADRLLRATRAGRFCVAKDLASYQEFSPYHWIGEDVIAGLDWLASQPPSAIERRIGAAQLFIRERFSPWYVARAWERECLSC